MGRWHFPASPVVLLNRIRGPTSSTPSTATMRSPTSKPAARSNLLTAMMRLHSLTLTGSASFSIFGWNERVWVLSLGGFIASFALGFLPGRKDILAEMPDKSLPGRKDILAEMPMDRSFNMEL